MYAGWLSLVLPVNSGPSSASLVRLNIRLRKLNYGKYCLRSDLCLYDCIILLCNLFPGTPENY